MPVKGGVHDPLHDALPASIGLDLPPGLAIVMGYFEAEQESVLLGLADLQNGGPHQQWLCENAKMMTTVKLQDL
jgi:hypothetical protein